MGSEESLILAKSATLNHPMTTSNFPAWQHRLRLLVVMELTEWQPITITLLSLLQPKAQMVYFLETTMGYVGLYLLALLVQTIKQFVQNDYHSWSDSFLIHLNLMVKLVKQQLLILITKASKFLIPSKIVDS